MGQAKEFLMEANDMLCYSNSAKMQPTHIVEQLRVNVDKHEKQTQDFLILLHAKKKATTNE